MLDTDIPQSTRKSGEFISLPCMLQQMNVFVGSFILDGEGERTQLARHRDTTTAHTARAGDGELRGSLDDYS